MGKKHILGVVIIVFLIFLSLNVLSEDCEYIYDGFDSQTYTENTFNETYGVTTPVYNNSFFSSSSDVNSVGLYYYFNESVSYSNYSLNIDYTMYNSTTVNPQLYFNDEDAGEGITFMVSGQVKRFQIFSSCSLNWYGVNGAVNLEDLETLEISVDAINKIFTFDSNNGEFVHDYNYSDCSDLDFSSIYISNINNYTFLDSVEIFSTINTPIDNKDSCDVTYEPVIAVPVYVNNTFANPSSPNTLEDLNFGAVCSQGDSVNLTAKCQLYVNNNLFEAEKSLDILSDENSVFCTVSSDETLVDDDWKAKLWCSNGTIDSSYLETDILTIVSAPCYENWDLVSSCDDVELGDYINLSYMDLNSCNTTFNLPVDNNTLFRCGYKGYETTDFVKIIIDGIGNFFYTILTLITIVILFGLFIYFYKKAKGKK